MPTPRRFTTNADRQRAYRQRQQQARQEELRRKGLPPAPSVPTIPGTARWNAALKQTQSTLEMLRDEMEDYFADRSEDWQEGDRGEALRERIEGIEELIEGVQALLDVG